MRAPVHVALILAAGCIHEHTVSTLRPPASSIEAVARFGDGGDGDVLAQEGPDGVARWVAVDPVPGVTAEGGTVDAARIASYSTVNRRRGMLEGGLIGGTLGAVSGTVVALVDGTDCPAGSSCFGRTAGKTAAVAAVLAGAGLLIGGIAGASAGSHDVYRLESPVAPRVSAAVHSRGADAALTWSF